MRKQLEPGLKIVCLALAVALGAQVLHRAFRLDPLGRAVIPPLPRLASVTNSPPVPPPMVTSNAAPAIHPPVTGTNAKATGTNAPVETNKVAVASNGVSNLTNAAPDSAPKVGRGKLPGEHRPGGPHFGGPRPMAALPAEVQTRVDKVKESGILAPFMRPPPMALLGIADDEAFLRAPDGQTGLVKVGDELGGVKLLRIGMNRVLVEQDGEKKELMLFNGAGGESLMPPPADPPAKIAAKKADQKDTP